MGPMAQAVREDLRRDEEDQGLPGRHELERQGDDGASSELKTEATEIKKGPIPASAFEIPAGYKKKDSPFPRSSGSGAVGTRLVPMDALVSTDWLAQHLHDPDLRVVDVRWYLDPARRGRDAYAPGHIPGAVFLDVERDLSAPGGGRGGPPAGIPGPRRSRSRA